MSESEFPQITPTENVYGGERGRVLPIELNFRIVFFLGGRKTIEPDKNPWSKDENEQTHQHGARSGIRTQATLV